MSVDEMEVWVTAVIEAFLDQSPTPLTKAARATFIDTLGPGIRAAFEKKRSAIFFGMGSSPAGFEPTMFAKLLWKEIEEAEKRGFETTEKLSIDDYNSPLPVLTDATIDEPPEVVDALDFEITIDDGELLRKDAQPKGQ